MAAAALLEEELQRSVATSEDDADFEEDDDLAAEMFDENEDAYAANNQLRDEILEGLSEMDEDDEDAEGEEDEFSEDDGQEGEDDDEMADPTEPNPDDEEEEEEEEEDEEDEDAEGVGAVKIQPGLPEDEDEDVESGSEEEESSASIDEDDDESKDSTDAEVEAQWQSAAEEEEEEEPANPNRCIFCQQDEENDPSEIFELYLACDVCGDNAHQQCARTAEALKADDDAEKWTCPECLVNNLQPEPVVPDPGQQEAVDLAARRISRDRVPGDLLPSQRGTIKPDSHSVFNQLIAPEDPMDGSRLLRKRKTSSAGASGEAGSISPVRTRHREKDTIAVGSGDSAAIQEEEGEAIEIDTPLANGHNKKVDFPASPRASRSLRPKFSPKVKPATISEKTSRSIKIVFRVNSTELQSILSKPPKPQKKRIRGSASSRPATSHATTTFTPSTYAQPFYSLHEKEIDELKSKPYGGILTEAEADTTLTLPKPEHRRQFDEARQNAEEEWKARVAAAAEAAAASGLKKPRKVSGPASQIEYIEFGQYQIDIWYAAPYPEEYSRNKALFICEFCLKYMESDIVAWRHKTKCHWKHPPGDEIYRDGKIMIFEVDGRKNPLYCQNLCLLAKLFLGSKTLYYDVEPFLFYVMTEYDELGCHFVGYFSKEKRPSSQNNVSCILVLPIHQRKGYGHLLIDFSYLLTRVEKKTGSPEKPLSDMGLVSYRNYWRLIMCYYLQDYASGDQMPSVRQMSDELGLTPDDVISALDALGSMVRDSATGTYAFKLRTEYYREVIRQHEDKNYAKLNPKGLVWTPYIMGRGNASSFDHAPPLHNVAQRDDDDEDLEDQGIIVNSGKRDFATFNGDNNSDTIDTDHIIESLGKLTTQPTIKVESNGVNGKSSTPKANGIAKKLTYFEAAAAIPAIRFDVFPPIPGTRKAAAPRPSTSRPPARPRSSMGTTPTRPRPRSRPSTSSSRRSSTTAPPRSHKKKPGGTGRGPGRWPRGTSKADFGNADSGPGLPPKLLARRSRLGNEVLLGDEEAEIEVEDEEEVIGESEAGEEDDLAIVFEKPKTRRDRQSGRFGMGLGKPPLDGKSLKGLGKGKSPLTEDDGDEEMDDPEAEFDELDVDADGESE